MLLHRRLNSGQSDSTLAITACRRIGMLWRRDACAWVPLLIITGVLVTATNNSVPEIRFRELTNQQKTDGTDQAEDLTSKLVKTREFVCIEDNATGGYDSTILRFVDDTCYEKEVHAGCFGSAKSSTGNYKISEQVLILECNADEKQRVEELYVVPWGDAILFVYSEMIDAFCEDVNTKVLPGRLT